ncbi:hypothetical protein OHB24_18405 [Kribbella sp. NBC_00482]|uniref:hypothetical protein n=1 Tax=Kribbella sp. NBC_00482 TaxID=2975968 RepID=UPI002E18FC4F
MKLGAAVYAFLAIGLLVSGVLTLRQYGPYADVHGWPLMATAVVDALAGLVFGAGAVTRRGLAADEGPWICRKGWLVVVALTIAGFLTAAVSGFDMSPLPIGPVVLYPHWVKRLQEKYYEGREEAERELSPEEPGGVRRPTV